MAYTSRLTDTLRQVAQEPDVARLSILLGFLRDYQAARAWPQVAVAVTLFLSLAVASVVCLAVPTLLGLWWPFRMFLALAGILAFVITLASVINLRNKLNPLISYYFTRFFLLDQQEKVINALNVALANPDPPIILYLRNFSSERLNDSFLLVDGVLGNQIAAGAVVVAIADPASDTTERLSPISKVLVQTDRWQRLVDDLIPRADLIVFCVDQYTPGVLEEIDMLARHRKLAKTILISNADPVLPLDTSPELTVTEWAQKIRLDLQDPVATLSTLSDAITRTLGRGVPLIHGIPLITYAEPGSSISDVPIRIGYAHGIGAVIPRLFLYGVSDWLPVGNSLKKYRRRFAYSPHWDPFRDIRERFLAAESAAYRSGAAVPPLRMILEVPDGSPAAESIRKWNDSQRLTTRMETAAGVLGELTTWRLIRTAIHR